MFTLDTGYDEKSRRDYVMPMTIYWFVRHSAQSENTLGGHSASTAIGRELPFAFALVHSPLLGAKQTFTKQAFQQGGGLQTASSRRSKLTTANRASTLHFRLPDRHFR